MCHIDRMPIPACTPGGLKSRCRERIHSGRQCQQRRQWRGGRPQPLRQPGAGRRRRQPAGGAPGGRWAPPADRVRGGRPQHICLAAAAAAAGATPQRIRAGAAGCRGQGKLFKGNICMRVRVSAAVSGFLLIRTHRCARILTVQRWSKFCPISNHERCSAHPQSS